MNVEIIDARFVKSNLEAELHRFVPYFTPQSLSYRRFPLSICIIDPPCVALVKIWYEGQNEEVRQPRVVAFCRKAWNQ
jgi:hypothetical protein